MDYQFLFYCFLSVVLIAGGAFYFYSSRQEVTSIVYFLGAISASIFFGLRWFSSSGNLKQGAASGVWPPVINYCPDFLSLATVNGTQVCIDTVGVGLAGGISRSDGTQVSPNFTFNLSLGTSGQERAILLCNEAKINKVTWEGLWNGSTCTEKEPPKPPLPVKDT